MSTAVIVAGALTLPVSIFQSNPADADVSTATTAEGELLPPLWDDDAHPFKTSAASSSYFAYQHDVWSGERDRSWRVLSTSDGHTVTSVPSEPVVVGPFQIRSSQTDTGYQVEYVDPATSESRGTVTLTSPEYPVCVHQSGVLTRRYVNGSWQLWILQRDGSEKYVPGIAVTAGFECVDMEERNVLLRSEGGLRTIDVQTGATRTFATVTPDWAALTSGRVIWRTGTTTTADGVVQHLAWADRNGQKTGTVDVPFTETLQTLGDDLLVLHKPAGGADYRMEARRISVGDGAVSAPLLTDARGGTSLEDGTFLVGTPTAAYVLSPDGAVREVLPLPRARERAWGLAMSGDRVVASWIDGWAPSDNLRMSDTTTSAGATWTPPRTNIAGLHSSDEPIQLAGDVLVTRPRMLATDTVEPNYVVEWPGGRREIRQYAHNVKLGRGGRLLAYHPMDATGYVVEDARTGERFGPADYLNKTAIDGTWVWTGPNSTGVLSGRDVVTGQVKTVKTSMPEHCSLYSGVLSVVGRWAMYCGIVVDLIGVLPDRTPDLGFYPWVLGDGFVASSKRFDANVREILVTDLNDPAAPQRIYGPASDNTWVDGRGSIVVDDSGSPRFAYVDSEEQVRVATLDWLHAVPPTTRPDKTAPALTSASAGPRLSTTRSLAFAYTFTDPSPGEVEPASGLASYDVRIQQRSSSTAPYGQWRQPWSGTPATRVTMTAAPGVDTCFQARGRDRLGNVSAWSTSRCTLVDGTKPTLSSQSAGDRVRLSSSVKFAFAFTDNGQLSTYDVAYRTAPAGQPLGSWVYPTGWQGIRSTNVSLTASAGSDTCFMVRARDAAGNTTAWSPSSCSSLPLDDRALTTAGSVTRSTSSLAYQGTTSRLNKPGAAVNRPGQAGKRVAVVALAGPGQGVVEVWHAGHKLGRISLAATSWGRRTYYLPATSYLSSMLSVISVSMAYSSIDAITVLRY
ncbi:hypothetical protein [Pseudonocardia sp.]|uniref:hypothetical protein n=1 Tax=Pseudonocardia sp. TaxID=60912 RepID=UPI0031FD3604